MQFASFLDGPAYEIIGREAKLVGVVAEELTGAGIFAEYDVNGLLRGDMKTRFTSDAQGIQWGWLNRDEVRGYENLEPIPEGEGAKFLVPFNMQALADEQADEPNDSDA